MGAILALLLGIAAGFVVLGMPTRLLEAVTTFTHLSKLMIQAEPPISPSDQTLLGALAGILTAGIGWVLVDWMLFGRAGMRTLIREREDDYEDEEGDAFRPTDPLDLVAPVNLPTGDWAPQPAGDARRPLSARTDIGDPPKPAFPPGLQPAAMPSIDQLLPPINQILPGMGGAAPSFPPAPPVQPATAPNPFGQLSVEPRSGNILGGPAATALDVASTPSWPQTVEPAVEQPPRPSAWLPTPGVRPDGSASFADVPAPSDEVDEFFSFSAPTAQPPQPAPPPDPFGQAPPPPWLDTPAPSPHFMPPASPPEIAPMLAPAGVAAPPHPIAFEPSAPPIAHPPAFESPAPPVVQPPAFSPLTVQPPAPAVAIPQSPPARRPAPDPGFAGMDRARLEDLLVRLERGLRARRAATASAAAAVAAQQPPVAIPQAPLADPPISYSPPPIAPAPFEPPFSYAPPRPVTPPPGFAAPQPQPVASTTAPVYELPTMPISPAYDLAPLAPLSEPFAPEPRAALNEPDSDQLLDQPLHVTLDLLRNKVKR